MSFANNITNTVGTLGVSRGGTNLTATPTNGQLPIGNGTGYTLATLSAGSGISVTNASGSITIAATGGGFTSVVTQVFTSGGTYTPTTGMDFCIVEVVGGGGGSGGIPATTATETSASPGGGGGGYARKVFASATIGASQTVTIGAGGTAGAAGANAGGNGGTTSLGSLITATGGDGSIAGVVTGTTYVVRKGASGGNGTLGDINVNGNPGGNLVIIYNATTDRRGFSGWGGSSVLGGSIQGLVTTNGTAPGLDYGGGAGGSYNLASQAARAGAAGGNGICIITEFVG